MSRLEVKDLTVCAGNTRLLDEVSLELAVGEVVALVGSSGSGKTLTLRAILDLLPMRPGRVSGEVRVDGATRTGASLRGQVGLIFQDARASLDPLRTVGRQVRHAARLAGVPDPGPGLLSRLGFPDPEAAAGRFPHELSGGMAATAVALARQSRFLFCDEPTTGLDVPVQAALVRELRDLREVGILFVTHDLRLLPGFADRILVIDGGRIVEEATSLQGLAAAGRELLDATAAIAAPGWLGRPQ
jgi:ABC-type dipeptide/oligopeptide/nickel transport system ATPase component